MDKFGFEVLEWIILSLKYKQFYVSSSSFDENTLRKVVLHSQKDKYLLIMCIKIEVNDVG